jgi:hypothetical protein
LFAWGIPKIIYSPLEAFKEILQNPRYRGAFLILILFIAAYTTSAYVIVTKTYDEQTLPTLSQGDKWTENRAGWMSNGNSPEEANDTVGGGFFGNKSIQFSAVNYSQIWMQLDFSEHVNCSSFNGYTDMSCRIKMIEPESLETKNVTVTLFSNQSNYFSYNLTDVMVPYNATVWKNLTIPVGPGRGWKETGTNHDWANITAIRFDFFGIGNASWNLRLDGLFFRGGYKPSADSVTGYIFSYAMISVMLFVIRWIFLCGLLYMLGKALGGNVVWRAILVLVGFALVTMLIQATINVVIYSTLPQINYQLESFGGPKGESEEALRKVFDQTWLVAQINSYVQIAVHVWTIALCAILMRVSSELPWVKSALIAAAAYTATILAESLLLGF